jgi:hypothetical protein
MGKIRTFRVVGLREDGSQSVVAEGISLDYAEKVVRLLLLRFGYDAFRIEPVESEGEGADSGRDHRISGNG